jgi:hypothetical protein
MTRCVIDGFLHGFNADRKSPAGAPRGGRTGRDCGGGSPRPNPAPCRTVAHPAPPDARATRSAGDAARDVQRALSQSLRNGAVSARELHRVRHFRRAPRCAEQRRASSATPPRDVARDRRAAAELRRRRARCAPTSPPSARATQPPAGVTRCNDLLDPRDVTQRALRVAPRRAAATPSTRCAADTTTRLLTFLPGRRRTPNRA